MRHVIRPAGLAAASLLLVTTAGSAQTGDDPLGRDCLGGGRAKGRCLPFPLTTATSRNYALIVDGASVYWTSTVSYQVNQTSLHGGPIRTLASLGQAAGVTDVALRGGYLLWTASADGRIWRMAPGSSSPEPVAIADGQGGPHSLATDRTHAYWTNFDSGSVARVALRPAPGAPAEVLTAGHDRPVAIAVDHDPDGYVYFTVAGSRPGIVRVSKQGGAAVTLAPAVRPYGVLRHGAFVYFTDFHGGTVQRVPAEGGAVATIASGQDQPVGLAADDQHVYWTNYGGGTVMRAGLDGGGVVELASGQVRPLRLHVDENALYWVSDEWDFERCPTPECGAVMKLAK